MNFFEQQDLAYKNTKRLLMLLVLAVASLILITTLLFGAIAYYAELNSHRQNYGVQLSLWEGITHALSLKVFAEIALGVTAVVFLGGLYRFAQLSSGGRAVAESMGGRLINRLNADADEKKILNVVEEMAIASGTPVPPVYVIEDDAINAFAAGHTPQDAVIGITRGCIHVLNRDELQGVIAHEFSHIFHGDMKLNMRLVSLLYGILLLGLIGQFIFRSAYYTSGSSRNKNGNAFLFLGIGLMVIGYAGTFFGGLIKSGVSRQREFLADASAVKFTRNPDGIGGALKKLGGYVGGSQLESAGAAEFSHMFFSEGIASPLFNLMATHPPLEERIRRIDPRWDGKFEQIGLDEEGFNSGSYIKEGRLSSPIPEAAHGGKPIEFISPKNPIAMAAMVDQVLQTMGQPTQAHVDYARSTLDAITDDMHLAANSPWDAQALMFGLLLDADPKIQTLQWQMLGEIFTAEQCQSLKKWALRTVSLAANLRLPLVEISLPALKNLSPQQYQDFKKALAQLIRADGKVNLMEWSFYSILVHNLQPRTSAPKQLDLNQLKSETALLLSVLANTGADNAADAQTAYASSAEIIENPHIIFKPEQYSIKDLDSAILKLHGLKPLQKPKLLKAMSQCVMADQKITIEEAELFRAIADALDCPVPPILHQVSAAQNLQS